MRGVILMLAFVLSASFAASAYAIGDKGLAKAVAQRAGVDADVAAKVLAAFKEEVIAQLKAGEDVRLRGFGRFYVKHMKARKGRNPKTGEEIQISARNYLRFKPSKQANAKLNEQ